MPSIHFTNLTASILELKRVYLGGSLAQPVASPDQQELARAFVVLAHAEIEHYVEQALLVLADEALKNAMQGRFSVASLSMLAFGGLDPIKGGEALGGNKAARNVNSQFNLAYKNVKQAIEGNHGAREKHLAAMGIPLGFGLAKIDSTWLADLDAFCSYRGKFAHMSRTAGMASHFGVNPNDLWIMCERLVWAKPKITGQGMVDSFEAFDAWIEDERLKFGQVVAAASVKQGFLNRIRSWLRL